LTSDAATAGRSENALRAWLGPDDPPPQVAYGAQVTMTLLLPPERGAALIAFAAAQGLEVRQGALRVVRLAVAAADRNMAE